VIPSVIHNRQSPLDSTDFLFMMVASLRTLVLKTINNISMYAVFLMGGTCSTNGGEEEHI
jgi:hypothetical protein